MPSRYWSFLAAFTLLIAAPCRADRVYRLVDYPANQNGHFLDGTITTSDDAPADSLLDVSEILGWQWSISGANTFAASSLDFASDLSAVSNVQISSATISLTYGPPSYNVGSLQLGRHASLGGRGAYEHMISWSIYSARGGPRASSLARQQQGDAVQSFWSGSTAFLTSSSWIIAIAVPEPATGLIITACAMACVFRRSTLSRG